MSNALYGPLDPAADAGWEDHPPRKGFFTDKSVCIGCKACEVACREWNEVPDDGFNLLGMSYDNTGALGGSTWRHVAFIEQPKPLGGQDSGMRRSPVALGMPSIGAPTASPPDGAADGDAGPEDRPDFRWLMSSDVCKHCTHAACLDVCPTGSLFRTEFGTVVVQDDICNGCGYCVPACPFGVIERRTGTEGTKNVGLAQKCTLCYDRLGAGNAPACAQACPTESIQFGDVDELRERAQERVEGLHARGVTEARLYGEDPDDGIGGAGAMFLLLDEPEVYGLPPDPVVTTKDLPQMYNRASAAAVALLAGAVVAFIGRRR
ncbi:MAG: 4Fe-4S dicluster domain-containing protein [Acidimicrobiales bacterium]